MEGRWFKSERGAFLKGMSAPFRNAPSLSSRSKASIERETSLDSLVKRVTPQIIESYRLGMTWETPEEWDRNFYALGGGQSRRKSNKILARTSWENFIKISQEILKNQDQL